MKVKKIKVGLKDLKTVLDDFVKTGEAIERGGKVKKETGVYFTSLEAFRKALTPKRLELLHIIKTRKPSSISELARFAKRDIKNISDDVKFLKRSGFIVIEEGKRKSTPVVKYDKINFEIAV